MVLQLQQSRAVNRSETSRMIIQRMQAKTGVRQIRAHLIHWSWGCPNRKASDAPHIVTTMRTIHARNSTESKPKMIRRSARTTEHIPPTGRTWMQMWQRFVTTCVGLGRLFSPAARGVYHPQVSSHTILGVALPPDTDLDAVSRRLWWRGLGIVVRGGQAIAGADITVAVQQRKVRRARAFVTKQLRDAGVRGAVKRWE